MFRTTFRFKANALSLKIGDFVHFAGVQHVVEKVEADISNNQLRRIVLANQSLPNSSSSDRVTVYLPFHFPMTITRKK
jgi:hypothetical protein